ncbi:SulP family inorganic anion transporter [Leifsonia sp. NPDC077715]|uniref:SulP family inorganic anion transporter n=1 Tax=Leifsonia sp. NPDC077715 TaxID=3155539 RepID=UPI00342F1DED
MAGVNRKNLVREVLAGVTLLAIAVPLNIGYAQIAGLPPVVGLYSMVVPSILYALIVSSRQVVASPDAAGSALIAASLGGLAVAGSSGYLALAFAQAILSGVLFLLCAFLKLGFLADFLSKPILVGFVGGLALDILLSQVARMLGVRLQPGGEFVDKLVGLATGLPSSNGWAVLISLGSLAILLIGRRIAAVVPWALVVLIVATVVVKLAGPAMPDVAVLGPVQAGPPQFGWPSVSLAQWIQLIPSAAALTVVTIGEGLLVSRAYAQRRGYTTRPNRDLFAFGVANIGAGLSGGYSIGSSVSRTAAMDQAGSRTQLPSVVAALAALLLLLFGTGLLESIPSAAIGAIVAVAVFPLLGIGELVSLWREDRFEFAIAAVCFLTSAVIGPIAGISIAFVLSVVNVVRRAANPPIDVLTANGDPHASLLEAAPAGESTAPGVVVIRLAAPLFFANGGTFEEAIRNAMTASGAAHLVLDLEAVTDVDVTGAASWRVMRRQLEERGADLSVSRARPDILERLEHFRLLDGVRVFDTNRAALAALRTDQDAR